ncbi:hypothetical protein EVAR_29346_1 [Eumeta japonica]|uniref:Uncharacterized protein n=1 Tax=Eumeta variegata TaxID=151549 RepID=A0A4C1WKB1_EUMVA|nr:hypothetical protein EVAR_29346_1 [Eumeta japonica]
MSKEKSWCCASDRRDITSCLTHVERFTAGDFIKQQSVPFVGAGASEAPPPGLYWTTMAARRAGPGRQQTRIGALLVPIIYDSLI